MTTVSESNGKLSKKRAEGFRRTFARLDALIDPQGARVLEVGADRGFHSAKAFVERGAEAVVATNSSAIDPAPVADEARISYLEVDATQGPFEDASFDIVYGRSILEHVMDIPALAAEVHRVLKPGGFFYLDGAPMWTCMYGHHVWTTGPSGTLYTFPDNNPVEPWEHLQFGPDVLRSRLRARLDRPEDAEAIVEYIHRSDNINRRTPTDIAMEFMQVPGLQCEVERHHSPGDPPYLSGFVREDLTTSALALIGVASSARTGQLRRHLSPATTTSSPTQPPLLLWERQLLSAVRELDRRGLRNLRRPAGKVLRRLGMR